MGSSFCKPGLIAYSGSGEITYATAVPEELSDEGITAESIVGRRICELIVSRDVLSFCFSQEDCAFSDVEWVTPSGALVTSRVFLQRLQPDWFVISRFFASRHHGHLSERDLELLRLLAADNTIGDIARIQDRSRSAVTTAVSRIRQRLGCKTTVGAVCKASSQGLL